MPRMNSSARSVIIPLPGHDPYFESTASRLAGLGPKVTFGCQRTAWAERDRGSRAATLGPGPR